MRKEELALFLGMLCGDGCIGIKRRKEGYKSYTLDFYNTDKNIVELFDKLLYNLFELNGRTYPRLRLGKKKIYEYRLYSKNVFDKMSSIGFPIGIKRDALRIPKIIKNGSRKEKLNFFQGFLITDGCVRKNKTIIFHIGSKRFLEQLSELVGELFGIKKEIKEYIQKNRYYSYQLTLNKKESEIILSSMPPSHNGIAPALRYSTFYEESL